MPILSSFRLISFPAARAKRTASHTRWRKVGTVPCQPPVPSPCSHSLARHGLLYSSSTKPQFQHLRTSRKKIPAADGLLEGDEPVSPDLGSHQKPISSTAPNAGPKARSCSISDRDERGPLSGLTVFYTDTEKNRSRKNAPEAYAKGNGRRPPAHPRTRSRRPLRRSPCWPAPDATPDIVNATAASALLKKTI